MIDDYTLSSNAASSGAGIYTFPIVAGHVGGTVGTDNTLGSTIWRCVQISRETRTDSLVLYLSALAVRPARRRIARVFRYRFVYRGAYYEGVAGHFRRASADRYVISDGAQGIHAADSEIARIPTLALNASPVSRTIGIQNTFRTTSKVRISLILGKARAHAVKALCICAAI